MLSKFLFIILTIFLFILIFTKKRIRRRYRHTYQKFFRITLILWLFGGIYLILYNPSYSYSIINKDNSQFDSNNKDDNRAIVASYKIEREITYNQHPNYPNGCESVALYILLKYYNIDLTVEDIVERLPKNKDFYRKEEILYAGDPEREYVGDPKSEYYGYGVYQKPIIEVANTFKKGMIDYSGHSLDDVLEIVSKNIPVQVWVSINIEDTSVCTSWIDEKTGKEIEWICNLHSLVIIGYDTTNIIASDPYTGKIEYYDRQQFERIYNLFNQRAIYYNESLT